MRSTTGRYTQTDYDFENPRARLETFRNLPKGSYSLNETEIYDYPGHYRNSERWRALFADPDGGARAFITRRWRGSGLVSNIEVGQGLPDRGASRDR